jgi:hypothetical protein
VDCFPDILGEMEDPEFRIVLGAAEETTIVVNLERGRMKEYAVEKSRVCLLNPAKVAAAAYQRILEVAIDREQLDLRGMNKFALGVALWHMGLPIDVLPAEGFLEVQLGEENAGWAVQPASEKAV